VGTCHAWLATSGTPDRDVMVQECGAGLISVRRMEDGLAFAAPALVRSGPVDLATIEEVAAQLDISRREVVDAAWADNGAGWVWRCYSRAPTLSCVFGRRLYISTSSHRTAPSGLPGSV
jgi:predicted PhzF superfamily epimerase YddE/YHI9